MFEVEWCYELPQLEDGSADIDAAKYASRDFQSHTAALRYARKMLPKDCWGSVRVTEFEMVPYEPGYPGQFREYVGEVETVE